MKTQLKIKKLNPDANLPKYATDGSGCMDLFVCSAGWTPMHQIAGVTIHPGRAHIFDTGLAMEVPSGHVLMIFSRSGHGFGHGVRLSNCVGIIDSDYRGPIRVRLQNDGFAKFEVFPNARIAQCMLVPIPAVECVEVESLSDTGRGSGGFGSTGA